MLDLNFILDIRSLEDLYKLREDYVNLRNYISAGKIMNILPGIRINKECINEIEYSLNNPVKNGLYCFLPFLTEREKKDLVNGLYLLTEAAK